jgi:xylan 1,4-beta-xylosidase
MLLQDAPLDVANYYAGDTNPFGLFTRHGTPRKTFYAFKAFRMLTETPLRVPADVAKDQPRVFAVAGMSEDRTAVGVLVSRFGAAGDQLELVMKHLPWGRVAAYELLQVGAEGLTRIGEGTIAANEGLHVTPVDPHAVVLVRLRKP